MLALPLKSTVPSRALGVWVAGLFAKGEQGVWYDPSDFSTMYQDAAGTIPVTAVGQPVGKILDKSGRGNHAAQSTTTSRPVLSARYNLLTNTEQFDSWIKQGITVTSNQDGTADLIIPTTTNSGHYASQDPIAVTPGATYRLSVKAKKAGYRYFGIAEVRAPTAGRIFDFDTGQYTLTSGTVVASTAQLQSDGYWLLTITFTAGSTATNIGIEFHTNGSNTFGLSTGDGISGALVKEASLVVVNDGVGIPTYQRVNTSTDYDTAGFPPYLSFDGVDDFLVTPNIDFTATDKMTVFAGVRKLLNGSRGIIAELSNSVLNNNGTWLISAPHDVNTDAAFYNKGTTFVGAIALGIYAPYSMVMTGVGNISSDVDVLRLNGVQAAASTSDQGTGNYGNYPLYIGRRGGTSFPFNGRLYGLIVRGAQTDDAHLTHAEKYLAYQTGIEL